MSVISLPTTLVLTANKGTKEILAPLNSAYSTIQDQATTSFNGFDKQLTTQYTGFGNQVVANSQESPQKASEKLQNISEGTAEWSKKINEHAATGNYYAFKFGHLIKALLKHTPNIIKESFIEAFLGGEDLHLLSAQKIYNIAAHEKFSEFLTTMTTVVNKHDQLLEGLSGEDNSGIIQIFKELRNNDDEIKTFLEKAKTNSTNLENNYACATKLMMHIFIGKQSIEEVQQTIEKLTTTLTQLESKLSDILKQIPNATISVDDLKQKLTEIKSSSAAMKEPCPQNKVS